MYFYDSGENAGEAGKNVFEACKTTIQPIMNLVLTYYFGTSTPDKRRKERIDDASTDEPINIFGKPAQEVHPIVIIVSPHCFNAWSAGSHMLNNGGALEGNLKPYNH